MRRAVTVRRYPGWPAVRAGPSDARRYKTVRTACGIVMKRQRRRQRTATTVLVQHQSHVRLIIIADCALTSRPAAVFIAKLITSLIDSWFKKERRGHTWLKGLTHREDKSSHTSRDHPARWFQPELVEFAVFFAVHECGTHQLQKNLLYWIFSDVSWFDRNNEQSCTLFFSQAPVWPRS